jgi:putative transposase
MMARNDSAKIVSVVDKEKNCELPKYCSEMNLIEEEWQRLKEDEIAGRMFDDEYDLAMAVIESIDSRSERRGYKAERFRFNHR